MDLTKRFSKKFTTYDDWRSQASSSEYTKRVERLHGRYPDATLSQLRGHSKGKEKQISKMKERSAYQKDWETLNPTEMEIREKSLKTLSLMRKKNYSLARASKEAGISPETVIRHTNALKKDGNKWAVKSQDRISRSMKINENGKEVIVHLKDSRHASSVGKYHSAVREFLHTGNISVLDPYHRKRIRDAKGDWHIFETNPRNLHEINERREEEEFYVIYSR